MRMMEAKDLAIYSSNKTGILLLALRRFYYFKKILMTGYIATISLKVSI